VVIIVLAVYLVSEVAVVIWIDNESAFGCVAQYNVAYREAMNRGRLGLRRSKD
jgi:hypothetical protein